MRGPDSRPCRWRSDGDGRPGNPSAEPAGPDSIRDRKPKPIRCGVAGSGRAPRRTGISQIMFEPQRGVATPPWGSDLRWPVMCRRNRQTYLATRSPVRGAFPSVCGVGDVRST